MLSAPNLSLPKILLRKYGILGIYCFV